MAQESTPNEIVLDDIMKESVKDIGKGESVPLKEETEINENQEQNPTNPQFGFKLEPVQAQEEFVVAPEKEEEEVDAKEFKSDFINESFGFFE